MADEAAEAALVAESGRPAIVAGMAISDKKGVRREANPGPQSHHARLPLTAKTRRPREAQARAGSGR